MNWNVSEIVTTIVLLIAIILMFAVLWQERKGNMNKPPNPHDNWKEKQALDGSKYWLHRTQTKNTNSHE